MDPIPRALALKVDDFGEYFRHARREAKEIATKATAEEDMEEVSTPNAIDEVEDKMITNIARFTAHLVLSTVTAGTGGVGRGERNGTRGS